MRFTLIVKIKIDFSDLCRANKPALYHKVIRTSKNDSQVGQNLLECCCAMNDMEWNIIDVCRTVDELMTIEAIYIIKLKPSLTTRDEYTERELQLKY